MIDFNEARKIIPNIDDFEKEIRRYSTPILCPNPTDPEKTGFGGGTFVKIGEDFGIFTAAHVADIF